ncbi:hypothetical protein F9L33_15470 [Amylibacter sp. SFDW26]|uniref:hypothetical protein n=1 Tax=Amylibacter sp. SFDW26 TaxID=2652722 RepID=UPI00126244FC|nr:hypothetical protein [Amylibacter sp. SFDW26]KAB7609819.1 hypothetical protein F9L33_15470 [Amylibacter sp. SFDW26]
MDFYISRIATLTFSETTTIIPINGIKTNRIRVDVADKMTSNERWLSEILVIGELPCFAGETREVILRISSDEFRSRVEKKYTKLLVFHGPDFLGEITFTNKEVSKEMLNIFA